MSLFDEVRQELHDAVVGEMASYTFTRKTLGAYGADPTAGRAKTTSTFTGRGYVAEYQAVEIDGTLIRHGDRKLVVLGASLSTVPAQGDTAVVDSKTYRVERVERDPAKATYKLTMRGTGA